MTNQNDVYVPELIIPERNYELKKLFDKHEVEKMFEDAWLNLHVNEETLPNPLLTIPDACKDRPELYIMWLMTQPEYFYLTCKVLLNVNILPFQSVILNQLWTHKFPMLIGSRGMSKSFMMAIYVILRLMFIPNRKIVIAGAGFRQSKVVFQYIETIVNNSPIMKDYLRGGNIKDSFRKGTDEWRVDIGSSNAIAIPIGSGEKLRGKRANDIFCDEFASMLIDIFETVIAGFGAVSSAPEKNVKRIAAEKLAKQMGLKLSDFENMIETTKNIDNQIVISGTAYYDFNHFSKYHDKWKAIIKTRGDRHKLKELLGGENLDDSFKAEDYSIIRIPYELIPEGFMDASQVSRSKATMHSGNYEMEFGAIFSKDSMGFFKRTLVESCVVKDDENHKVVIDGKTYHNNQMFFEPKMYGDRNKTYVMGIDPAIAADNFAIVILEVDPPFRKVVYCWVTNKKDHIEKIKLGLTKEHNYYAYAARKIRELCKIFPCVRIAIDSEGGGRAIMESLRDKDKLNAGEVPIYRIINHDKPNYEEDGETGLHIIDEISFSSASWVSDANHGMKKDMEDGILLFPYVDSISFAEADYEDEEASRHYDSEQQNIKDIEEIKNELITIVVTESKTGREGFDTPEIKTGTGRKGRMKKDRYSALLMANMTGRIMMNTEEVDLTMSVGGFSNFIPKKDTGNTRLFTGPSFVADKLAQLYR